jgi:hypothetical protein
MRVFLTLLLFDIVFRSLSVLAPLGDWRDDLGMDRMPRRLPTRAEFVELAKQTAEDEHPDPVTSRLFDSADSVWEYYRPWPDWRVRRKLATGEDWGKWALCWLSSRCQLVESVVGFDQEWPMFSPNVRKKNRVTRAELTYADGTTKEVRMLADPEDLTRYAHWNQEKILDHELHVKDGCLEDCLGYCNLLTHRHATSPSGARLVRIGLKEVRYDLPPPDVDPVAFLRAQSGPPADSGRIDRGPFFVYDPATRQGDWKDQPKGPP